MMASFCAYVEKVFGSGSRLGTLCDARCQPVIPVTAVFASAFTMFATAPVDQSLARCLAPWHRQLARGP